MQGLTLSRQMAAIVSFGFGVVLTVLKLTVGLLTGSLSILAEAIDATLDLFASGVTALAVRIADQPPDDNHPYGHARADNLGALAETTLLVATSLWIVWQALERIFVRPAVPDVNAWSFLVISLSLGVNLFRVAILHRATARERSQALTASIANFTNDMLGSLVVLVALSLIAFGPWLGLPSWFIEPIDALAAIFVALFGLFTAWRLGREAICALMDDVPPDLNRRLVRRVSEIPDVVPNSANVRTRFVGEQPYVDVVVGTPRDRSLEEAHLLATDVERVIRSELDDAKVLVHVEPTRIATEPHATAVYSIAQRLGLRVHNLDLYQVADGVRLQMDLELPGRMSLAEAHTHSEQLAAAIAAELPDSASVAIHLEPRRDHLQPAVRYEPVVRQVQEALASLPGAGDILRADTFLTDLGIIVILHCSFAGATSLTEVHDRMEWIQRDLHRAMPEIVRVHIDPEPLVNPPAPRKRG